MNKNSDTYNEVARGTRVKFYDCWWKAVEGGGASDFCILRWELEFAT